MRVMGNPRTDLPWSVTPSPSRSIDRPHAHPQVELDLILQGTGVLRCEDEVFEARPGTLFWIPPGVSHQLVEFTRDFRLHIGMLPEPEGSLPSQICVHPAPETVRRLDVLFALLRDARDLEERDLAAKLLVYVARATLSERANPVIDHAGLAAALSELERHPGASRTRLAQVAKVAPATLSRLMVAGTGRTLQNLRREARVERFLELARSRPGTLLEHALAAGYGSYSQCHHDCLRVTGHPPRIMVSMDGGRSPHPIPS